MGEYLGEALKELASRHEIILEARGLGLMQGLELKEAAGPYIQKALDEGLILMGAGANVIRFVPPLVIEKKHVDEMIKILDKILS